MGRGGKVPAPQAIPAPNASQHLRLGEADVAGTSECYLSSMPAQLVPLLLVLKI